MYASYSTQLKKYKEIIKCCPPTVIKVNYSELEHLIARNKLSPGSTYLLVDYQTIYDQPDFENNFILKTMLPTLYGSIEPLFVTAVSTQLLSDTATSLYYPNDIIKYKAGGVTPINHVNTKGTILYREDNLHNSTWYDFRQILFKRYIVDGIHYVNDPGGTSSNNFYTFSNGCYNIQCDYMNKSNQLLPNNIFPMNSYNIKTGINFCNNTFMLPITNTTFQYNCSNNLFLNLVNNNTIQNECSGNIINGVFTNNKIQNGFINNVTGNFTNNSIGNNFSNNTIGNFTNNTIQNNFSNNDLNDFIYNIVQHTFSSNHLPLVDMNNNCFYDEFINNTLDTNFQYNHVYVPLTNKILTSYLTLYSTITCKIITSNNLRIWIEYLKDDAPIVGTLLQYDEII
jgi:hypothetical protein